jgi:hypothetical protein
MVHCLQMSKGLSKCGEAKIYRHRGPISRLQTLRPLASEAEGGVTTKQTKIYYLTTDFTKITVILNK